MNYVRMLLKLEAELLGNASEFLTLACSANDIIQHEAARSIAEHLQNEAALLHEKALAELQRLNLLAHFEGQT